ncbi:kelch-like protein 41b [Sabethes cyaneus]|uniref:kelch-like protein 41b n=1 Tax=Sabethes cyaneus TaxID=53552 RepID=UPI00237ED130|nr:kelch-like protein 41b [Sabethes cyaneus]
MAKSEGKTTKEFTFPLPVADRDEQLVNNEYLSDVQFSVGNDGERMYGHKVILTLASEVFYAQFNGQFKESQRRNQTIVVTDIQPPIFRDILRYMYCQKIDLTQDNVIEVYYASQKYILTELNKICEQYFENEINETNVLKVFNENRKHEFAVVNESCLDVIRDNPVACFQHPDFVTIEKKTLEMIASSARINCLQDQLQEAIKNWAKVNKLPPDDAFLLTQMVQDMKQRKHDCLKLHNFNQFKFAANIETNIQIKACTLRPVALNGVGIFVKSRSEPPANAKISLKVQVEHFNSSERIKQISLEKIVPLTTELRTEDVFFERFIVDARRYCKIRISFEKLSALPELFCLTEFGSIDNVLQVEDTKSPYIFSRDVTNCVAYLLYKNMDPKSAPGK